MPVRVTVLASGSSGNAALIDVDGRGLLVDCGVGPRVLADRLAAAGLAWSAVAAVVLTHTHGDHWNVHTLAHLRRRNTPLFAHSHHHAFLAGYAEHEPLRTAGLIRTFAEAPFEPVPGFICHPVRIPHDADPTYGFRIESGGDPGWAVGYASDVGHPTLALAAAFAGVDLLAIEFNHDVGMQKASGRSKLLIERVLGDDGHLSNVQAAGFTRALVAAGGLRHVVQLHLSRDCNTPGKAMAAGKAAIGRAAVGITTALPFATTRSLIVADRPRPSYRPPVALDFTLPPAQPRLPGFDDAAVW